MEISRRNLVKGGLCLGGYILVKNKLEWLDKIISTPTSSISTSKPTPNRFTLGNNRYLSDVPHSAILYEFRMGDTIFGHDDSGWTTNEMENVFNTLNNGYSINNDYYGTQPTNNQGKTGIYVILTKDFPEGMDSLGYRGVYDDGGNTQIIGVKNPYDEYILLYELGFCFWGTHSIPHMYMNGFSDASTSVIGNLTGKKYVNRREILTGTTIFKPHKFNKRKMATYAPDYFNTLLRDFRTVGAGDSLYMAYIEDPDFLNKFRKKIYNLILDTRNTEIPLTIFRKSMRESYKGDIEQLFIKQPILSKEPSDQEEQYVVFSPTTKFSGEALNVVAFKTKGPGESPLKDVPVEVKIMNKTDGKVLHQNFKTNENGGAVTVNFGPGKWDIEATATTSFDEDKLYHYFEIPQKV